MKTPLFALAALFASTSSFAASITVKTTTEILEGLQIADGSCVTTIVENGDAGSVSAANESKIEMVLRDADQIQVGEVTNTRKARERMGATFKVIASRDMKEGAIPVVKLQGEIAIADQAEGSPVLATKKLELIALDAETLSFPLTSVSITVSKGSNGRCQVARLSISP